MCMNILIICIWLHLLHHINFPTHVEHPLSILMPDREKSKQNKEHRSVQTNIKLWFSVQMHKPVRIHHKLLWHLLFWRTSACQTLTWLPSIFFLQPFQQPKKITGFSASKSWKLTEIQMPSRLVHLHHPQGFRAWQIDAAPYLHIQYLEQIVEQHISNYLYIYINLYIYIYMVFRILILQV